MTPADYERHVAVAVAYIRQGIPEGSVPPSWTRYCQGLRARNRLLTLDPDSEQAQAVYAAMGRLGLVVAE